MGNDYNKDKPDGLWAACTQTELAAITTLEEKMQPFSKVIGNLYESGVEVLTLPGQRHHLDDVLISALLLKRVLNDLRTVWITLLSGYTSQAASIAASLYEHALSINAIAGNPDKCRLLKNSSSGDLPWSPMELAKLFANQMKEESIIINKSFDQLDERLICLEVYSAYKFLCKIKHPTLRSVLHDSQSTALDNKPYVVMSLPDTREEDMPIKATILIISISRTYQAIRRLSFYLKCDIRSEAHTAFVSKFRTILEHATEAYKIIMNGASLPYDIREESIAKEYFNLRRNKI
ncbi:hypothetical protein [Hymenobacter edaphi]|uniref:hypothetical protein n=1 Tax=Hymenobacter edaphi TaxID=2211146 RepID=UPI0010576FF9|nr:hypothetical protein [Hymenobacter edaphi]